jgi:nucleotide-binding universal stress UspA family protein
VHVVSACVPYSGDEMQRLRAELPAEFHDLIDPFAPAHDHITSARVILAGSNIEVIGHEVTGDPSNAILDVADQEHADLIVVGARGLSALQRFTRGSVSTRVAHHSKCDVLIVEHDD